MERSRMGTYSFYDGYQKQGSLDRDPDSFGDELSGTSKFEGTVQRLTRLTRDDRSEQSGGRQHCRIRSRSRDRDSAQEDLFRELGLQDSGRRHTNRNWVKQSDKTELHDRRAVIRTPDNSEEGLREAPESRGGRHWREPQDWIQRYGKELPSERHPGIGTRLEKVHLAPFEADPIILHVADVESEYAGDLDLTVRLTTPYRPLNRSHQEIRLLVVNPGLKNSELKCQLHSLHLNTAIPAKSLYETVSYCWGDKENTSKLDVDGVLISVPSSAVEALCRLRHNHCVRKLWIDSVCINQDDGEERGQQVALMHDIYRLATRNLVWLGQDDGTVDQAMEIMDSLTDEASAETGSFRRYKTTIRSSNGHLRYSKSGFSFEFDPMPLSNLFSRPWFSRTWVIQEATLARSNMCFCGPHQFDLIEVLRSAQWLYYKQEHIPPTDSHQILMDHLLNAAILANFVDPELGWFHRACESGKMNGTLFSLLDSLAKFDATDPRDHVYGLLGLYQRLSPSKTLPSPLRPDYKKSMADVFCDATRFAIQEMGELESLSWVRHRIDDRMDPSGLPTWVPSWHRKWNHQVDEQSFASFFDAGGNDLTQKGHSRPEQPRMIMLDGFLVDGQDGNHVEALTDICDSTEDISLFIDSATEVASSSRTAYPNNVQKSLAITLLAGRNADNRPAKEADFRDFISLQTYRSMKGALPPTARVLRASLAATGEDSNQRQYAARYTDALWHACARRRFFVTKAGRIGVGPQTMQVGDAVVVLYGSKWPFVFRPHGETYEMVGHCYVHGVMYGEAVEKHKAEGSQDIKFLIR